MTKTNKKTKPRVKEKEVQYKEEMKVKTVGEKLAVVVLVIEKEINKVLREKKESMKKIETTKNDVKNIYKQKKRLYFLIANCF